MIGKVDVAAGHRRRLSLFENVLAHVSSQVKCEHYINTIKCKSAGYACKVVLNSNMEKCSGYVVMQIVAKQ